MLFITFQCKNVFSVAKIPKISGFFFFFRNKNILHKTAFSCAETVPVGGGLPVMMHLSVTSEPLGVTVSSRGLSNLGPSVCSSSADM